MKRRPPTPANPSRPSALRLYLAPADVAQLDARAVRERRSRAAQVSVDVEAWLASPVPVPAIPADVEPTNAKLDGALLVRVERLVGVEMRTRAIEAAVATANAASKKAT